MLCPGGGGGGGGGGYYAIKTALSVRYVWSSS